LVRVQPGELQNPCNCRETRKGASRGALLGTEEASSAYRLARSCFRAWNSSSLRSPRSLNPSRASSCPTTSSWGGELGDASSSVVVKPAPRLPIGSLTSSGVGTAGSLWIGFRPSSLGRESPNRIGNNYYLDEHEQHHTPPRRSSVRAASTTSAREHCGNKRLRTCRGNETVGETRPWRNATQRHSGTVPANPPVNPVEVQAAPFSGGLSPSGLSAPQNRPPRPCYSRLSEATTSGVRSHIPTMEASTGGDPRRSFRYLPSHDIGTPTVETWMRSTLQGSPCPRFSSASSRACLDSWSESNENPRQPRPHRNPHGSGI
jgi:hypothetical protein